MPQLKYSKEDIARRGEDLYEQSIRLSQSGDGKICDLLRQPLL